MCCQGNWSNISWLSDFRASAMYFVSHFLRGGLVSVNWDVKELEENREAIVEKGLLKSSWLPANLGERGHPFWDCLSVMLAVQVENISSFGAMNINLVLIRCGEFESLTCACA